jgi:class 3 adenylate cyclase
VARAAALIPILSGVIESVWRRHLASAARSRIMRDDEAPQQPVTVGFADLEGFTTLSQQLPEHELAELVNRFEQVAYDIVARFSGARVVKMIGDEVMFSTEDVRVGVELALTLAEAYAAEEALGDVRVGLATGRALKLEGDLYGPAVNLASRIVSIAYPGSLVVSPEVFEALADDPDLKFRSLRSHHLRNIGRVKLWRLARAEAPVADDVEVVEEEGEEGESRTLRRARERRAARRIWIADRMAEKLADLAAETAGDVTDRAVRRIIEGKPTPGEPAGLGVADELSD